MKNLQARLAAYWAERDPREQRLLTIAGVLLILVLLYALWAPLARQQARLERRIPELAQELASIEQSAARWRQAQGAGGQHDWRSATQARLVIHHLAPAQARLLSSEGNSQRWQFDKVTFNDWLNWLSSLYVDFGLRVKQADITPAGPGEIQAQVEIYQP